MHVLAINPNATPALTAKLVAFARDIAPPGVTVSGATGRFGARYISSRAAAAIAGHAALDCYAEDGAKADAVLLACFGDPGLLALRELAHCPVLGLAEASCHAAAQRFGRFSIITGGARWQPMLTEFVASLGLGERLASVRAVAPTGGEIAANPEAAHALLAEAANAAAREDGAEAVILGGAGLIGIAGAIGPRVRVPLLCSVETGFRAIFAVAPSAFDKTAQGAFAPAAPVESIGLGAALTAKLAGE